MSKIVVLKTKDVETLDTALNLDADLLLMQDAVYMATRGSEQNTKISQALEQETRVYVLELDASKRGVKNSLPEAVQYLDYDGLVDLLFSGRKVLNM